LQLPYAALCVTARPVKLRWWVAVWLSLVTGCFCWRGHTAPLGDPPSFRVTFPRYQYEGSFASVRDVDFRNLTLHVFRERGGVEFSASLKNGSFEARTDTYDSVKLDSVTYFRTKRSDLEKALVVFTWTSVGGSASVYRYIQIFEVLSGRLTISQQIEFIAYRRDVRFDVAELLLVIEATHYTGRDAHCCPSRLDIVRFRWTGRRFGRQSITTIPIPK
jgi:hypothetical protein